MLIFKTTTEDGYDNGIRVIEPVVFKDDRGYFIESFNEAAYELPVGKFVQDNESCSKAGTFRGFHYQTGQYAQAKLVRVVKGAVIDIVIDLRQSSKTFKKAYAFYLDENKKQQLFVPRGFAHGFIAKYDDTIFCYKCDNYYKKEAEAGVSAFDPEVIKLVEDADMTIAALTSKMKSLTSFTPEQYIVSEKDKLHPFLKDALLFD